jgi:hypothetical protein
MTVNPNSTPDLITSLFGSSGDMIFLVILVFGIAVYVIVFAKGKIAGIG